MSSWRASLYEQEQAEDVEGGLERLEQRGADQDEHEPQEQREHDPPAEHRRLNLPRHREVTEDHREHEDVVERQRALEQVTRQVLGAGLAALPEPQPRAEHEREHQPAHRPDRRLAQGGRVVAGEHEQVDREQRDHENTED
jgi:hypothetical protein